MGGYWSKKDKQEKEEGRGGGEVADGELAKKSKYTVVYTDREIKPCELPRDLGSIFVLKRRGSMFMDEDGHFAHEFYREKRVRNKRGVVRWMMERVSNTLLIPQGEVSHPHPRLHVDFPLVLLDSNALLVSRGTKN